MNTWILTYDIRILLKYFQHLFRRNQLNLIRLCINNGLNKILESVVEIPGTQLQLPVLARVVV